MLPVGLCLNKLIVIFVIVPNAVEADPREVQVFLGEGNKEYICIRPSFVLKVPSCFTTSGLGLHHCAGLEQICV